MDSKVIEIVVVLSMFGIMIVGTIISVGCLIIGTVALVGNMQYRRENPNAPPLFDRGQWVSPDGEAITNDHHQMEKIWPDITKDYDKVLDILQGNAPTPDRHPEDVAVEERSSQWVSDYLKSKGAQSTMPSPAPPNMEEDHDPQD
jgi:hypothetical protein